jgi:hypothetical protein
MTLEELIEKRKEIDAQIRAMKNDGSKYCERVRLTKEHYTTGRPDEWRVSIRSNTTGTGITERWISVISGADRETVIMAIPELIENLQGFSRELKGGME